MQNLSSIVPIAFLIVTFVTVLVSALVCSRKKLPYSLSRIGCTIVAALIAVIAAISLRSTVGNQLYDLVLSLLDGDTVELLDSVSSVGAIMKTLISLLTAPILFLLFFLVLFTLLSVISGIVLRILHQATPETSKDTPKKNRFLTSGFWIGVAHGLILSIVIFIPLCGYLSVVSDTLRELQTSIEDNGGGNLLDASSHDSIDLVESISDNFVVQGIHKSAGKLVFHPLTSGTCKLQDGTAFSLKLDSDLPQLGQLLGTALCMTDRLGDIKKSDSLSADDRALLEETCDLMLESNMVRVMSADLIKTAATNWSEDKSFAGISAPSSEPVLQPTIRVTLKIFTDESAELLEDDLHTVIELLEIVIDSHILDDGLSNEDLMSLLGSSKGEKSVLQSIQECLRNNAHMSSLADEIDALSVRVVALVLDQSGLNDGKYDEALNSVAAVVNEVVIMEGEERSEYIKVNVKEALDEHEEVNIPDDVAVALCEKIIADFAATGEEVTGESLKEYLTKHAAELSSEIGGDYDFDPDDLDPDAIDDYLGGETT